jgi:hypothetical protein
MTSAYFIPSRLESVQAKERQSARYWVSEDSLSQADTLTTLFHEVLTDQPLPGMSVPRDVSKDLYEHPNRLHVLRAILEASTRMPILEGAVRSIRQFNDPDTGQFTNIRLLFEVPGITFEESRRAVSELRKSVVGLSRDRGLLVSVLPF